MQSKSKQVAPNAPHNKAAQSNDVEINTQQPPKPLKPKKGGADAIPGSAPETDSAQNHPAPTDAKTKP